MSQHPLRIPFVAGTGERASAGARPAGPLTRVRARLGGRSLDRCLSDGVDPASSALLAQRAAYLTSTKTRRSLARSIRRLLDAPAQRRGPSAAVSPHRGELGAARLPLARVAALLEIDEPVYARGVAQVELLLTEGSSALYAPQRAGQLRGEVEAILNAMEGREETW